MPSNDTRHFLRPLKPAIEQRTRPTYDKDRDAELRQRENDAIFVRKLLVAIWRGDNLPAGHPKPVRPLVLTP